MFFEFCSKNHWKGCKNYIQNEHIWLKNFFTQLDSNCLSTKTVLIISYLNVFKKNCQNFKKVIFELKNICRQMEKNILLKN